MNTIQLFLHQHSMVHSAEVSDGDTEWSLADNVLDGVSDEQMRARPGGMNSLAWLVWHMARTEDVTVNLLVAGRPQVLDDGDWRDRLNLRHDVGTTMNDEEVEGFSQDVDIAAVCAYRVAVGRRTREIVENLRPEELNEIVEPSQVAALLAQGAFVEGAIQRFVGFWGGKSKAFFLNMPATGHNFMHLSEAITVRRQLK